MHLPFDESPDEKAARRAFGLFVWLVALGVLAVILAAAGGCAAPAPRCENAQAFIARAEGMGLFYGFTPESLAQWTNVIRMEARGECAWPKEGVPL